MRRPAQAGVQGAQAPLPGCGAGPVPRQRHGPLRGVEGGAAPLTSLGAGHEVSGREYAGEEGVSGAAVRTALPTATFKCAFLTATRRAGARPPWRSMSLSPAVPRPEPTSSIRQTYPANPTDLLARAGSSSERDSLCPSPHPDPKLRGEVRWREIELLTLHLPLAPPSLTWAAAGALERGVGSSSWLSGKARTLAAGQSPAMRGLAGARWAAWEPSGASRGPGPRAGALRAAPPPLDPPPGPNLAAQGQAGATVAPIPLLSALPIPP